MKNLTDLYQLLPTAGNHYATSGGWVCRLFFFLSVEERLKITVKDIANFLATHSKDTSLENLERWEKEALVIEQRLWQKWFQINFPDLFDDTIKKFQRLHEEKGQISCWKRAFKRAKDRECYSEVFKPDRQAYQLDQNAQIQAKENRIFSVGQSVFLSAGILDRSTENPQASPAIFLEAELGYLETVKNYIEHSENDPLIRNAAGDTLLHIAAEAGHIQIVQYLIKKQKAIVSLTNHEGKRACYYACINGHLECLKVIMSDLEKSDRKERLIDYLDCSIGLDNHEMYCWISDELCSRTTKDNNLLNYQLQLLCRVIRSNSGTSILQNFLSEMSEEDRMRFLNQHYPSLKIEEFSTLEMGFLFDGAALLNPIGIAIANHNIAAFDVLLSYGPDINRYDERNNFWWTSGNYRLYFASTYLSHAIGSKSPWMMLKLLENDANIHEVILNFPKQHTLNILLESSALDEALVEYLLRHPEFLCCEYHNGGYPSFLHLAVTLQSFELTKKILTLQNAEKMLNLYSSTLYESPSIKGKRIDRQLPSNQQMNPTMVTPLHLALRERNMRIAFLLIENGANINGKSTYTHGEPLNPQKYKCNALSVLLCRDDGLKPFDIKMTLLLLANPKLEKDQRETYGLENFLRRYFSTALLTLLLIQKIQTPLGDLSSEFPETYHLALSMFNQNPDEHHHSASAKKRRLTD